jgi:hypothetical protein
MIATLERAAKRFAPKPDTARKLEKALAGLRTIEARRLELLEWDKAGEQAAAGLLRELQGEIPSVDRGNGLDAFRESYKSWLRRHLELGWLIKEVREWGAGLYRQQVGAKGAQDITRLKSEFGNLKQTLADAVCLSLASAKLRATAITEEEQTRLDGIYGAGKEKAERLAVVQEARNKIKRLEGFVTRIQTESIESFYPDVVPFLLGSEEGEEYWLHKATNEVFTSLTFGSKLNADNELEKVYQLRNRTRYRECSEAEFEAQFEEL